MRLPVKQAGATLMETMIALGISIIVITAMVVLMSNTMGTSNRITQMTQLTDELRNVMSLMTRDVRRANYSSMAIFCYGNPNCSEHALTRQEGSANAIGDILVDGECLRFQLDRLENLDGDATNDSKGGFRRVTTGGVGIIEMWVNTGSATPTCDAAAGADSWVAVTDPNIVDITALTIDDGLSASTSIFQESGTTTYTQRQRQLRLVVGGELILEQGMGWTQENNLIMVQRELEDVINVRNDYLSPPVPVS